jgi:hypothetical protein
MTENILIPNIHNYSQKIINGNLILIPNKKYITENDLNMINFDYSLIVECLIIKGNEIISKNTQYQSILIDIWKTMNTTKILQNTSYKFKLKLNNDRGYSWCNHINMFFQSKDEKNTLNEIINMVKINNMDIYLSIKLHSNKIIYFKL